MLQDLWFFFSSIFDFLVSIITHIVTAFRFFFQIPTLATTIVGFLPSILAVALIHVIVIAVLQAIFRR